MKHGGGKFGDALKRAACVALMAALAACGGGGGSADSGGGGGSGGGGSTPPAVVAPTVTTQPQAASVQAGATASFTVTAAGTAPLAYQWLRGGVAIAGATGASYTTPATVIGDNGASFSVTITNSAGSVTSTAAVLTVTAPPVAASITTGPQSVAVKVGLTASFSVTAAGTAPLSYQWRLNGTDIAGATAASYTTAATALADSGARYSVKVSNAAGSQTSADALLTVNPLVSVLSGRAWTAGQSLEVDDNQVLGSSYAIDDHGNAVVVFPKYNGTRYVLYAMRGTPGAAGAAPTWSTPAAIDMQGATALSAMNSANLSFDVAMSPNGNAVARWINFEPCTANTYYPGALSSGCRFLYTARFMAASGSWESPVRVTDIPSTSYFAMNINDAGDVSLLVPGWVRSGTSGYTAAPTVAWRANGVAAYQSRVFGDVALGKVILSEDAAGNLLLAAEASQNATTDLVVYRGTMAAGFGAQQILDTRGPAAGLLGANVGLNGQQIVLWSQNNGTAASVFAATSGTATGTFSVADLAVTPPSSGAYTAISIDDAGNALWLDSTRAYRMRWTSGAWAAKEALPADFPNSAWGCTSARTGDAACLRGSYPSGQWASYDATGNAMVQSTSPASYILGVQTGNSSSYGTPTLSISGIAISLLLAPYDTLPTPALPNGDGRNVNNLWGFFLK